MLDDNSIIGASLNQLGQTVKQAVKQTVKLPEEMAKDIAGQVAGSVPLRQGSEGQAKQNASSESKGWKSDEERLKFLKDLYGSTDHNSSEKKETKKPTTTINPLATAIEKEKPSEFQEQIKDKTPEEQKKLMELRQQLHKEKYYDPTFNPVKKQEERPAEKVENEKKQEMVDLQQKEAKKPPPLEVARAQNKAEMFRGTSG